MSTLYNNERAYCFLSEAEQAELEAAQKEVRVVFLSLSDSWKKLSDSQTQFYGPSVYRITKPELTKPSVDWDHVADWVTCMATDQHGENYFFGSRPARSTWGWTPFGRYAMVGPFKSFRPGTCDWKDSLVMRPGVGK